MYVEQVAMATLLMTLEPGRKKQSTPHCYAINTWGNAPKSNLKPFQCSSVWLTGSKQYHAAELSLAVPGHCGRKQERRREGELKKS